MATAALEEASSVSQPPSGQTTISAPSPARPAAGARGPAPEPPSGVHLPVATTSGVFISFHFAAGVRASLDRAFAQRCDRCSISHDVTAGSGEVLDQLQTMRVMRNNSLALDAGVGRLPRGTNVKLPRAPIACQYPSSVTPSSASHSGRSNNGVINCRSSCSYLSSPRWLTLLSASMIGLRWSGWLAKYSGYRHALEELRIVWPAKLALDRACSCAGSSPPGPRSQRARSRAGYRP